MTAATLILCIWLAPVNPADPILARMGLIEPPPCVLAVVETTSYFECQKMLPHDVALRRKVYGNATGECLASPPRPPGLPEPGPKKGPTA